MGRDIEPDLVLAISDLVRMLTPIPDDEKEQFAEQLVSLSRGADLKPRFVSWRHHRDVVGYLLRMLRFVSQSNVELRAEVEMMREQMQKAGIKPPPR
jgi:hypothetical protein